ncbi:MAG: DUF721 domain-containing protein [Desulfobacteraceae bacterium]|nr:DUF721 domain-containing protein [Desulfobacteraceae bacterium]
MKNRRKNNKNFSTVGSVIDTILPNHGPATSPALLKIWDIWENAVGAHIASQARPAAFKGDLLLIHVSNSTFLHHLSFMQKDLIRSLNCALGREGVRAVKFKIGPI